MKKSTLLGAAMIAALSCGSIPVQAQDIPSASRTVYDFSGWNNRNMLNLFAKAADEGRMFPTKEEFEAAGIYLDLEFVRSHVRYNPIIEQSAESNLVSSVYPQRRIWMNLPTGAGKGTGGFPSGEFNSDVYSMWNYTHIFGSWNHGFMQAPGSWVDAAHRNGTYMYSGIEFFDYASGNQSAYTMFITTQKEDGSYKYLDAVLNCLLFLGQDGINYNFEQGLPSETLLLFHSALYKRAKEIGFDSFHIGAYTNTSNILPSTAYALVGDDTKTLNGMKLGKVHDAFLNYAGGDFAWSGVANSLTAAKAALGTAEDVYQGVWIVTMDRAWPGMNRETTKEMNLCLWGEHSESRFWQYNVGTSVMNAQENYQILQDRTTGGGNRNVLNRPAIAGSGHKFSVMVDQVDQQMKTFAGFASMAPERSSVQGALPFNTYFSLGNGEIYFYKGKKTHGSWYNMAQQDYVPTYRWLLTKAGSMNTASSDIDVRFSHEEAYIGGSSIRISGATTGSDLIIYKTNLDVNGSDVKATVAVKNMVEGTADSNLSLILQKADGSWVEVPYGQTSDRAWESKTLNVSGLSAGDVIKHIGVRVAGSSNDYKLYLGQIMIEDGSAAKTPAPINADSFIAEVKEETTNSLSVKLNWEVNDAGYTTEFKNRGMVYNDEVNIDHFELFVKNGADGKAYEVARTSSWHAFVANIDLEQFADPYIGVRSVSTDLRTASSVVWINIERYNNPSELPEFQSDLYAKCYIDRSSNGFFTALAQRWFEEVKTTGATEDLNYFRSEAIGAVDDDTNTNYVLAEDELVVTQGQSIKMKIRGHRAPDNAPKYANEDTPRVSGYGNDGVRYCLMKAYIDWDRDRVFDATAGSDECIWSYGTNNSGDGGTIEDYGYEFTLNIPADAAPGDSRLRIVASDAWFGAPNPTGALNKGCALDIPVKILGTNTPRQPKPGYLDYRDGGEADSPLAAIDDIVISGEGSSSMSFYPAVTSDVVNFTDVQKAWIYSIGGQMVKFIPDATAPVSVSDLSSGAYVVKMQKGQIVRSGKLIKK